MISWKRDKYFSVPYRLMDFTIVCICNHVHNTLIVCSSKKISVNKIVLNKKRRVILLQRLLLGYLFCFYEKSTFTQAFVVAKYYASVCSGKIFQLFKFNTELTQVTFTCLNSSIETLEKGVKYVQGQQ